MRTTLYFLCFLSLIWGCDQQAEAPPQPKVITKKIVAKKKATVPQKLQKIDTAKPEIKKQAPQPIATVPAKQTLPPKAAAVVKQIPQPKTKIAAAATQTESEAKDKKLLASLAPTVQKLVLLDSADVYNPQGKLDPFEPLFKEERSAPVTRLKKKAKKPRHLTPLEQFSLSQLKLVGIKGDLFLDYAEVFGSHLNRLFDARDFGVFECNWNFGRIYRHRAEERGVFEPAYYCLFYTD